MARWFSSQGKKKTAMAEGRVRDFNAVGISKSSEDSHGVRKISDSPPPTIDSGNNFTEISHKSLSIGYVYKE